METDPPKQESPALTAMLTRLARRLLVIGENRAQLLMVELEEERDRMAAALVLVIMAAVFGTLAGVAFTVIIVVVFWQYSPVLALVALGSLYTLGLIICLVRLRGLRQNWHTLAATADQLKKDRECLEKNLN